MQSLDLSPTPVIATCLWGMFHSSSNRLMLTDWGNFCWSFVVTVFEAAGQMPHIMVLICCFTLLGNSAHWSFSRGLILLSFTSVVFNLKLYSFCLLGLPRSASEVHPQKRQFLRLNAGQAGEILVWTGFYVWAIYLLFPTWACLRLRICADIFTRESDRVPIYNVTWWDMVGVFPQGFPRFFGSTRG